MNNAAALNQNPPAIEVWYGANQKFGQNGNPQRWINVLGKVSSKHGISSLHYSLNGETELPLSIGPDRYRLSSVGDFNVEIDRSVLVQGKNEVAIVATDMLNNKCSEKIYIHYKKGKPRPLPYFIDWDRSSSIQDVAQIVDGFWRLEGGTVRCVMPGYDRLIAVGDIAWSNYEVCVPITIHDFDESGFTHPSCGPGVGLAVRWQGHWYNEVDRSWRRWLPTRVFRKSIWRNKKRLDQPRRGWWPLGALGWYRWRRKHHGRVNISGNDSFLIAEDRSGRKLELGVCYIYKMRVETRRGQTSVYSLKVWEEGTSEPNNWTLRGTGPEGELSHGSALLVAHEVDASFGKVSILPISSNH
jgi:hypothetical protein